MRKSSTFYDKKEKIYYSILLERTNNYSSIIEFIDQEHVVVLDMAIPIVFNEKKCEITEISFNSLSRVKTIGTLIFSDIVILGDIYDAIQDNEVQIDTLDFTKCLSLDSISFDENMLYNFTTKYNVKNIRIREDQLYHSHISDMIHPDYPNFEYSSEIGDEDAVLSLIVIPSKHRYDKIFIQENEIMIPRDMEYSDDGDYHRFIISYSNISFSKNVECFINGEKNVDDIMNIIILDRVIGSMYIPTFFHSIKCSSSYINLDCSDHDTITIEEEGFADSTGIIYVKSSVFNTLLSEGRIIEKDRKGETVYIFPECDGMFEDTTSEYPYYAGVVYCAVKEASS